MEEAELLTTYQYLNVVVKYEDYRNVYFSDMSLDFVISMYKISGFQGVSPNYQDLFL
jgi:hypothetical protein